MRDIILDTSDEQIAKKESEIGMYSMDKLRQEIREIQNDEELDDREKAKKIQNLTASYYKKSKKEDEAAEDSDYETESKEAINDLNNFKNSNIQGNSESNSENVEVDINTFHDIDKHIFGCKHYARGCKIIAPCCEKTYTCRFCHDEQNDHELDRYKIKSMKCMYCKTIQEANQKCKHCNKVLGHYFCKVCNFWDDTITKEIFHCEACNICRVGKGLGIDFKHCNKCNVCIGINIFENHKCIQSNSKSDCPVCFDFLPTSRDQVTFMRCGHMIHLKCLIELSNNTYQCPLCSKSLADMSEYFNQLDEHTKLPLPIEFQNRRSNVFCCDCETRSITKFHFIYHKCSNCGSYATKVLDSYEVEGDEFENYKDLPEPVTYTFDPNEYDEVDIDENIDEESSELNDINNPNIQENEDPDQDDASSE